LSVSGSHTTRTHARYVYVYLVSGVAAPTWQVAGSRELLATLRHQQATMPRPTLELRILLPKSPNKDKGKGPTPKELHMTHTPTAHRLVADLLSWMGVSPLGLEPALFLCIGL
jgi:hypothetical protein